MVLGAIGGVCLGLGGYTFYYAEGASYLSNDPKACVNCHIMRDEYDAWQKSGHHTVATCNDCHVPHTLVRKYLTKLENGYHHSKSFTFQDFKEPIRMRPASAAVVQENCIRCHGDLVSPLLTHSGADEDPDNCLRCHARVGHQTLN